MVRKGEDDTDSVENGLEGVIVDAWVREKRCTVLLIAASSVIHSSGPSLLAPSHLPMLHLLPCHLRQRTGLQPCKCTYASIGPTLPNAGSDKSEGGVFSNIFPPSFEESSVRA